MATQVVELTGDEAALLRSLDKVIQKEREHERQLARTAGASDATGDKLESALRRVEKANNQAMRSMVRDLQALGPEGRAAAEELKAQLTAAGKGDFKTVDGILNDLAKLDPAAATAAAAVRAKLSEADPKEAFDNTLASLKELGPEGAAIARGIEQDMKTAAVEAAGGLDPIIQKLAEIEPTAATSAARVRTELREADAATRFDNSLAELRKLNPEAAKAADAVRSQMTLADKQVKFDGIVAELEKIDPKVAEEARKFRGHMKDATEDGTEMFGKFADFTATKVTGLLASFGGVSALLKEINKYIEDKAKSDKDSAEYQTKLALVQQEALKGFVSLTPEERNFLINEAPQQIAARSGNADILEITRALGNIDSSASTDQAVAAVEAAARINLLSPDKITDFAVGAVALGRATGIEDPAANIGLMQSMSEVSNIDNLQNVANVLAPAVAAAVAATPQQDRVEVSRDAAALFAILTKGLQDQEGNETATAFSTFNSRLASLFDSLDATIVESRSAVEKLELQIAKADEEQRTELAAKLRLELDRHQSFLADAVGFSDPKTLMGRFTALQENTGLRDQFFSTNFGGDKARDVFRMLADPTSPLATELRSSREFINADPEKFSELTQILSAGSPVLQMTTANKRIETGSTVTKSTDIEAAARERIRDWTEKTLLDTRQTGFVAWLSSLQEETGIRPSVYTGNFGSSAAEEAVENIGRLALRRKGYEAGGIEPNEVQAIERIDSTIAALREIITTQSERLEPGSIAAAADRARTLAMRSRGQGDEGLGSMYEALAKDFRRVAEAVEAQNRMMAEQTELQKQTAENTAPLPEPVPNYNDISRSQMAQEDAR